MKINNLQNKGCVRLLVSRGIKTYNVILKTLIKNLKLNWISAMTICQTIIWSRYHLANYALNVMVIGPVESKIEPVKRQTLLATLKAKFLQDYESSLWNKNT